MSLAYIGKTCPYCKTPFAEGETVVFCSVCEMPHHLSCWQDNQGCTTFGCTGSIQTIVGNPQAEVAASAPQPTYTPPAPVPTPQPVYTPQAPAPMPPQPVYAPQAPAPMPPQPVYAPQAPAPMPPQPVYAPQAPAPTPPQPVYAPQAPAPTPPQPVHTSPAPASKPTPPAGPTEILTESRELRFLADIPLVLENTALMISRAQNQLFARCTFRTTSDRAMRAVLIDVHCQDVWGNTLGEPISFQYLDLNTHCDTRFGQSIMIPLTDKTTRTIEVTVRKVLYADNTVADGNGIAFTMPAPTPLNQHFNNEELAAAYQRETTSKARFIPIYGDTHWYCTCGALNTVDEVACHHCGCTSEKLDAALDVEILNANIEAYAAEQKAAADLARIAEEARMRRAQENAQKDQERKERELRMAEMLAQEQQRIKRKRKATLIVILASIVVLAIIIFFGVPFSKYMQAQKYLDNQQYDYAYNLFVSLDGFLDSEEKATATLYKHACALMDEKEYGEAAELFRQIRYYKNSETNLMEAMYGYVQAHKNNDDTTTYAYLIELRDEGYRDASAIYTNLYAWKVTVDGWNSSETGTTYKTSLSKYGNVLCHFTVTGGPPGGTTILHVSGSSPNGSNLDYTFENECYDGWTGWYGWNNGFYTNPEYGATGTVRVYFYDSYDNLIGSGSVRITN